MLVGLIKVYKYRRYIFIESVYDFNFVEKEKLENVLLRISY